MKFTLIKPLFGIVLLLFAIACIALSCSKTGLIKPNNTITNTKSDSAAAAVDTLPSFSSPSGIALDAAGNIYVADYGNNLIRKITTSGIVSTVAGTGMQGAINATGIIASFNGPSGIAADAAGNLYVADSGNNLIRKITQAGVVSTLAGSDTTGSANGQGINSSFFGPVGVAVDTHGNVYVTDAGNNLIRFITPAGVVSTLAGNAVGASNGTLAVSAFNNPTGVAVDGAGNVYVANYLNNNILEINTAATVTTFAGTGQQGSTNGPANAATFYLPNNVTVDAHNNVYVADGVNNLIRKITPAGIVSTLAGSGVAGAADSTGTAASFNGPAGLAVDGAGNVYVADANNNLIRKITPAGIVTTVAGTSQPGAKNGKAFAHRNTALRKK